MAEQTKKTVKKSVAKPSPLEAEFRDFQKNTNDTLNSILNLLEKREGDTSGSVNVPQTTTPEPTKEMVAQADPNGQLQPQYQRLFEKYFDPADGFTARMSFPDVDEKGNETGGITFTIFVPLKFSNTDDGYRKMYKQDLRTRALLPHNIAKGIDEWCKVVARNLRYNRNIKTK